MCCVHHQTPGRSLGTRLVMWYKLRQYTNKVGGECTNGLGHLIHIKTSMRYQIYYHAHLIMSATGGVAARAGSVHSNDRKLGQKGGARTHPNQNHPVTQGRPLSMKI